MQITINDRCVEAAREFKRLQELMQQPADAITDAEIRGQNQRNHDLAIRIAGAVADGVTSEHQSQHGMVVFTAFTAGKPVDVSGCITEHTSQYTSNKIKTSVVHLRFGEIDIAIHFQEPEQLIQFCKKHKIPFKDER